MPRISLFSNNFPDRFIIERTGFIGETGQLRRATPLLGVVLQIATFDGFRMHGKFADGIIDPAVAAEVRADSTFVLEAGLIDPNQLTFRSVKFGDRVIRHRNFQLFAEQVNTPNDFQDATFRRASPLNG